MAKSNPIEIDWDLSCPQSKALKQLEDSIDNKFGLGWYKIKGRVDGPYFKIWTNTPGMRGQSIATGKGQINAKTDNDSHLTVSLSIVWPFRFFQLSKNLMIFVVLVAIISWGISLAGAIFSQYDILSNIFFPIGLLSIIIILFSSIRYFGESELKDLRKFLDKTFANLRNTS